MPSPLPPPTDAKELKRESREGERRAPRALRGLPEPEEDMPHRLPVLMRSLGLLSRGEALLCGGCSQVPDQAQHPDTVPYSFLGRSAAGNYPLHSKSQHADDPARRGHHS